MGPGEARLAGTFPAAPELFGFWTLGDTSGCSSTATAGTFKPGQAYMSSTVAGVASVNCSLPPTSGARGHDAAFSCTPATSAGYF